MGSKYSSDNIGDGPRANMIRVSPVKEHTDAPIDGFKFQSAADFQLAQSIYSLTINVDNTTLVASGNAVNHKVRTAARREAEHIDWMERTIIKTLKGADQMKVPYSTLFNARSVNQVSAGTKSGVLLDSGASIHLGAPTCVSVMDKATIRVQGYIHKLTW
jgi:hypothetical protein